jgi:putative transposase
MPRARKPASPFRYFNSSPKIIRLVVMMYVRFLLSLRNVEDLLAEQGIDICHETVRMWWNRFGPLFAADIKRQRISRMRGLSKLALGSALAPSPRRRVACARRRERAMLRFRQ